MPEYDDECPACGAGWTTREAQRGHCDACEEQRLLWDADTDQQKKDS